jgi:hypothetical protein
MSYFANNRWGASVREPTRDRMREILAELDLEDDEHPDASLSHETGWSLSAFGSGLVIWENIESSDEKARHMRGVSRDRVLELWLRLAEGEITAIEREPWLPGYGV